MYCNLAQIVCLTHTQHAEQYWGGRGGGGGGRGGEGGRGVRGGDSGGGGRGVSHTSL